MLCLRFLTDLHFVEQVHAELPWYSDLDAIWHSNPSFAAKTSGKMDIAIMAIMDHNGS